MTPKLQTLSIVGVGTGTLIAMLSTGTLNLVDLPVEQFTSTLSQAAQSQIAQTGFFFTLAAWLHSGRMKKEIKANFEALTTAINQVAAAFREDLQRHGDRLDNLDSRVQKIENNVVHNKE